MHTHRRLDAGLRRWGASLVGIVSVFWVLLRSGRRPSRAAYPCQKAAMANATAWLGTLALPAVLRRGAVVTPPWEARGLPARIRLRTFVLVAIGLALLLPLVSGLLPGAGVGAVEPGQLVRLELTSRPSSASGYSDIYAVQGTTGADQGFRRLIQLMERNGQSFYTLVGPDDVVIIKVNSQWDERGGTNTDLVRNIIESILEHPGGFRGEIVIADNGQAQYGSAGRGGTLDWTSNNAVDRRQSMQRVADELSVRHRVSIWSWDRITTTRVSEYADGDTRSGYVVAESASPRTGIIVSYPKFETAYGTFISFREGVWDPLRRSYDSGRLKVINVPVLKTHAIYGVTASVKHYMGVVSDKLTWHTAHGSVGSGGMGTEMAETRLPVLNVLDAIWINAAPGRGPRTSYTQAVETGIIAAGRDPVALDAWAARNVLLPAARSLGYGNTTSLDPTATRGGSFGDWLRRSMDELLRAGIPATMDLEGIGIIVSSLEDLRLE